MASLLQYFKRPLPFGAACFLLLAICLIPLVQAQEGETLRRSTEISGNPEVLELNLTEAVHLALRRNRTIESAYLDRIMQKYDLARERVTFSPALEIKPKMGTEAHGDSTRHGAGGAEPIRSRSRSIDATVTTEVSQKIPTGGELTFAWINDIKRNIRQDPTIGDKETGKLGWSVAFSQPLLKGAGSRYNRDSLVRAELAEEENRRSLRDTLIAEVNGVIRDYRELMLAQQGIDLARDALGKARKHLADNRILIEAGRRSANESLQAEADLARKELDLEEARQRADEAQLALLLRLELDSGTVIVPTEEVKLRLLEPVFHQCLALALERDSSYLSSLNSLERARWDLANVTNERLWELDLTARYSDGWQHRHPSSGFRQDDWDVGLIMTIPLPLYGKGKYDRERSLVNARIRVRQAEMRLQTARENLESRVRGTVRRVETSLTQVHLAERAVDLSEQTFSLSELKYQMGQMSNTAFIIEQDRLRDARTSLNRSIINYENALTELDGLLTTTLDTWEIAFKTERTDLEEEFLGARTWMLNRDSAKEQP